MTVEMIRQTSFNIGEVDENNWKQTQNADYLSAAQSLLNMQVTTTSLARKRGGTKFLLYVAGLAIQQSRMFEYVDKNNNHYIVMASDQVFHIFSVNTVSGVVTFLTSVSNPYVITYVRELDYALSNDVLVFSHPLYKPARLYISDYNLLTFTYEPLNIFPYPAYDFGNVDYNNATVALTAVGNQLTMDVTGPGLGVAFTTAWIGGQIIGGGASVEDPIGYAIITNVVQVAPNHARFFATIQIPFETTPGDYAILGSYYSIRQPAWSDALGWPAKVLYYQNRLWFANSAALRNTIFGSKINNFVNFDVGVGRDTDAIIYTLGESGTGGIVWLNGGKQLEIYTQNFEFVCTQDQNTGLTPSTFAIRQQASYGVSTNFKPCTYINNSYYLSRTGKSIINFQFEGVGLSYRATNISAACEHLVKNPIDRVVIKGDDNSQDNFIYWLNSDGSITTFQFAYEYKLSALTPMRFQSIEGSLLTEDGNIIQTETGQPIELEDFTPSIQVIDIVGIDNKLYFLKYYTLNGVYALERLDPLVKLDSFVESTMNTAGLVTGLDVLNGYDVDVVFNGSDYGTYRVVGSQIDVDNPEGVEGPVQVGMLFDVILRPMYVYASPIKTNFFKTIKRIYVDYYQSLDFVVNDQQVPYQYFSNIQSGAGLVPVTDTAVVDAVLGYERFQTFTISQRSPFDLVISAIAYEIDSALI